MEVSGETRNGAQSTLTGCGEVIRSGSWRPELIWDMDGRHFPSVNAGHDRVRTKFYTWRSRSRLFWPAPMSLSTFCATGRTPATGITLGRRCRGDEVRTITGCRRKQYSSLPNFQGLALPHRLSMPQQGRGALGSPPAPQFCVSSDQSHRHAPSSCRTM